MEDIVNIGKSPCMSLLAQYSNSIGRDWQPLFVLYGCRLDCCCIWGIAHHANILCCLVLVNSQNKFAMLH